MKRRIEKVFGYDASTGSPGTRYLRVSLSPRPGVSGVRR